jgi:AraC-like DNA-binding protein
VLDTGFAGVFMATISWTGVRGLGQFRAFCERIGDGAYRTILSRERVPEPLLDDLEAKIPLDKMFGLLDQGARASGSVLFGLKLGAQMIPGDYGAWIRYVVAAPTLGAMIGRTARTVMFYQTGASFALDRRPETAKWQYRSALAQHRGAIPHQDHIIWPMIRTVRAYCGPDWLPSWVELSYPRPDHARALEEDLGVPIRFGATAMGLAFPAALLERRALMHTPLDGMITFSDMRQIIRGAPPRTVAEGVRHLLRVTSREANADLSILTIEDVAQLLGRSSRSLQRDLNREGAGFRDMVSTMRIARARELIAGTDASLQEIAWHLGYSDLPHFTRAFRAQVGVTPSRFRDIAAGAGAGANGRHGMIPYP